jgi:hypothetical protein
VVEQIKKPVNLSKKGLRVFYLSIWQPTAGRNLAYPYGSEALRPTLSDGLPFSELTFFSLT